MSSSSMAPSPGAATMCNPAVIAACRVAYRAAALAGDPVVSAFVRRAWGRGNAELIVAYLEGLQFVLSSVEGAYDMWRDVRDAAHAVRMSEAVS